MTEKEGIHYGKLIKKLLNQKNISVRELSERTGRSTQAVYNIFRTQYPRIDVVIDVSLVLGFKYFIENLILNVDELKKSLSDEGDKISDAIEVHVQKETSARDKDRIFYTEKLELFEEKINSIEQSLSLAGQVIKAKDELIEQLRKDG
ncbi:MAG: helix-turn-helix transcriptional regulator [Bacteroidetes bacterium]|nr:helix-turn-helix transcriptional regulator [Bacteroidota bacterium]